MKPNLKQINKVMGVKRKRHQQMKNQTYQRFLDDTNSKGVDQQKRIDKNLELKKKHQQNRNKGLLY